jgi:hypothetical protein
MATLTKLMHSILHHDTEETNNDSLRPVKGMTERDKSVRKLEEATPMCIAQVVGYSGF